VSVVRRAEAALGLALAVVLVDLVDVEDGELAAALVGERDAVVLGRPVDGEADRKRPWEPARPMKPSSGESAPDASMSRSDSSREVSVTVSRRSSFSGRGPVRSIR